MCVAQDLFVVLFPVFASITLLRRIVCVRLAINDVAVRFELLCCFVASPTTVASGTRGCHQCCMVSKHSTVRTAGFLSWGNTERSPLSHALHTPPPPYRPMHHDTATTHPHLANSTNVLVWIELRVAVALPCGDRYCACGCSKARHVPAQRRERHLVGMSSSPSSLASLWQIMLISQTTGVLWLFFSTNQPRWV